MTSDSASITPFAIAAIGLVGVIVGSVISSIGQYLLMSRRIEADIALAKQKFDFEVKASRFKRKHELAEEALVGFYEFKDIMREIRSPISFGGEGGTRPRAAGELEDVSKAKDTYFVLLERLEKHRGNLAKIFGREYLIAAWFGSEAAAPFQELNRVLSESSAAAMTLVGIAEAQNHDPELVRNLQAKIWWTDLDNDPMIARLNNSVARMEAIFRPVLSEQP